MKTFVLSLALVACSSPPALEMERAPVEAPPAASAPTPAAPAASTGKLPILGDPLGLLSKPPAGAELPPRPRQAALSPDALMAAGRAPSPEARVFERDARAVAREQAVPERKLPLASTTLREATARRVMTDLRSSTAKLRVLFLYAAYCPACREVMPTVREAARRHYGKGVEFTAASVDRDREQYAAYVPTLEGVFPATLITSDGTTAQELKRLGVPLDGKGFAIPLVAVLDRKQRLVAYGNTHLAARLDQALTSLAEPQ
ncbi:MAG: thioredoxin family protein [Polyangiales bacterium]